MTNQIENQIENLEVFESMDFEVQSLQLGEVAEEIRTRFGKQNLTDFNFQSITSVLR